VTFLTLVWLLGAFPLGAQAIPCANNAGYGTRGLQADHQFGSRVTNNLVINPASTCSIVRSIYIVNSALNFVEVGWFENGPDYPGDPCDDVSTPHILVYAKVAGHIKCKPATPALNAGQSYSFRVDNPDHDNDFVYYWAGDQTPDISLGYFATGFTRGYAQSGDERTATSDSLRADFSGLNSLGGGGGWHNFENPSTYSEGNVSGFAICSWSGGHLEVKSSC
jgi:hypothetical protein